MISLRSAGLADKAGCKQEWAWRAEMDTIGMSLSDGTEVHINHNADWSGLAEIYIQGRAPFSMPAEIFLRVAKNIGRRIIDDIERKR
jgi:hypothetical protein